MLPQLFWKKIFDFPTLCMCRANRMCRIFPPIFMTKYVIPKIRHTPLTPPRSFASQNNLFFRTDSKTLDNFWSNGGCSAFFRHSGARVAPFKHLMDGAKPNQTQNPTQTWILCRNLNESHKSAELSPVTLPKWTGRAKTHIFRIFSVDHSKAISGTFALHERSAMQS